MKKTIAVITLLAILLSSCFALAEQQEQEIITSSFPTKFFQYIVLDDNTIEIVNYIGRDDGEEEAPIIPDLDGYAVTVIGKGAFSGHDKMIAVLIPESVTHIREEAFCNCSALESIYLSENVSVIEARAFMNCRSLTRERLQEGLVSIGEYAFSGCESLESLAIPDSVTWIGENAFSGCDLLTAVVGRDSYAEQYCKDSGIPYYYLDEDPYWSMD